MNDKDFVTNGIHLPTMLEIYGIGALTGQHERRSILNWIDNGYPCFYVPSRLIGMSWFRDIYLKTRERFFDDFMECVKTRNWEYRTIENLINIDWRKPNVQCSIRARC